MNRLLRCDLCEIDVHQTCYGVTDADLDALSIQRKKAALLEADNAAEVENEPKGTGWMCRRCTSTDKDVQCVLCPRKGGAFKRTTTGRWAHVACAQWIPETGFVDPVRMEPIEGVNDVLKSRRKLRCYLCKRPGPCIQCSDQCHSAFHPLCGLFSGGYMNMVDDGSSTTYTACCRKHTPIHLHRDLDIPPSYSRMIKLRRHLDTGRTLIDLTKKREKLKQRWVRSVWDLAQETFQQIKNPGAAPIQKVKPKKQSTSTAATGATTATPVRPTYVITSLATPLKLTPCPGTPPEYVETVRIRRITRPRETPATTTTTFTSPRPRRPLVSSTSPLLSKPRRSPPASTLAAPVTPLDLSVQLPSPTIGSGTRRSARSPTTPGLALPPSASPILYTSTSPVISSITAPSGGDSITVSLTPLTTPTTPAAGTGTGTGTGPTPSRVSNRKRRITIAHDPAADVTPTTQNKKRRLTAVHTPTTEAGGAVSVTVTAASPPATATTTTPAATTDAAAAGGSASFSAADATASTSTLAAAAPTADATAAGTTAAAAAAGTDSALVTSVSPKPKASPKASPVAGTRRSNRLSGADVPLELPPPAHAADVSTSAPEAEAKIDTSSKRKGSRSGRNSATSSPTASAVAEPATTAEEVTATPAASSNSKSKRGKAGSKQSSPTTTSATLSTSTTGRKSRSPSASRTSPTPASSTTTEPTDAERPPSPSPSAKRKRNRELDMLGISRKPARKKKDGESNGEKEEKQEDDAGDEEEKENGDQGDTKTSPANKKRKRGNETETPNPPKRALRSQDGEVDTDITPAKGKKGTTPKPTTAPSPPSSTRTRAAAPSKRVDTPHPSRRAKLFRIGHPILAFHRNQLAEATILDVQKTAKLVEQREHASPAAAIAARRNALPPMLTETERQREREVARRYGLTVADDDEYTYLVRFDGYDKAQDTYIPAVLAFERTQANKEMKRPVVTPKSQPKSHKR